MACLSTLYEETKIIESHYLPHYDEGYVVFHQGGHLHCDTIDQVKQYYPNYGTEKFASQCSPSHRVVDIRDRIDTDRKQVENQPNIATLSEALLFARRH